MTKREQFLEYAKAIKALGYRVFINRDTTWNYGYIVNEKDEIGYFQLGDYGYGIRFSTMHHGTRTMGSGFGLDDWDECKSEFTKEVVDRCFVRVPQHCYQSGWCRTQEELKDLERVKKYKASEYLSIVWNKDEIVEL